MRRSLARSRGVTSSSAPTTLTGYGITDSLSTAARLAGGGQLKAGLTLDMASGVVTPGTVGDSTHIPQITVDTYGRVTAATQVAASGGGYSQTVQTIATGSTVTVSTGTDVLEVKSGVAFPLVVTLPTGSTMLKPLYIVDQTGTAGQVKTISVARAGSDTIRGGTANVVCVARPYGQAIVTSNQGSPADFMVLGSTWGCAIFGVSGTWIAPPDITWWEATGVGAGGGGGSGAAGTASTAATGGAGGSGGEAQHLRFQAASLPGNATTTGLTVTVGTGGAGGANVTNSGSAVAGNPGASPANGTTIQDSTTAFYLACFPGTGGGGGKTTAVAAAGGGAAGPVSTWGGGGTFPGSAGASSSATGAAGSQPVSLASNGSLAAQSGASGGGCTSGNANSAGGTGGPIGGQLVNGTSTDPGQGGTAGTTGGGNGGNGVAFNGGPICGGPGGGGGGSNATGNAGHGGNGGSYGGGGGGGGSCQGAHTSGAGGNGANGICVIWCG